MNFASIWNSIKPNLIFAGKVAAGTVVAMATQSLVISANSALHDWREDSKKKEINAKAEVPNAQKQAA